MANSEATKTASSACGLPTSHPASAASAARASPTCRARPGRFRCDGGCPPPRLSWSLSLIPLAGFVFHSLSREGYRWKRDRPGCPLIAVLGPPSPRECRSDAERCRPSRTRLRACSARSCASTGPGRPVPEGPGRQGQRLARRDQQDRDGGAAPAEDFPPRLDAVPELDTRGALTRLWDHLKKGQKHRLYGWFQEWADIEAQATVLRWYEPLVVPGLLQTEDDVRAILSARPDGNLGDLGERDSKHPDGPQLAFAADTWKTFTKQLKATA